MLLKTVFRAHQCHYEQFGDISGTVTIDGTDHPLKLNVMRDHTHGSTRDRFYKTPFRLKTFLTNFHPQILDKFTPQKY
jgi:hypothetical protein